jgi:hypothetical protein
VEQDNLTIEVLDLEIRFGAGNLDGFHGVSISKASETSISLGGLILKVCKID